MATQYIDARALKAYIRKKYGTQFSEYVMRAVISAIDKQPVIQGDTENTQVAYQLHVLQGLLNYHRRMMVGVEIVSKEYGGDHAIDLCKLHFDGYAEALEEAIRCIKIVHGDELLGS